MNRSVSPVPGQASSSPSSSSSPEGVAAAATIAGGAKRPAAAAACTGCLPVTNGNGINGGVGGDGGDGSEDSCRGGGTAGGKSASGSAGGVESGRGGKIEAEETDSKNNGIEGEDDGENCGFDTSTVLEEVRHQVAQEYLPVMETIRDQLIAELKGIDKSEVSNVLCLRGDGYVALGSCNRRKMTN